MQERRPKLFCKLPFSRISIDDDGNVWPSCCPDWVLFPLGNIFKQKWEEIWHGQAAKLFREAMFDGTLKYCRWDWCPYIASAKSGIKNDVVIPLKESPRNWDEGPPIHVNMNYDRTCNLKCPSCRPDYIHFTGEKLKKVQYLQEYVEKNILPHVESIAMTGVGEVFMSRVFLNFLTNFDSKKYPRLKSIHFHTNGLLFDEKMYNSMKGIHHLNLSTDISIDAASEDVYKVVREPGNWNTLLKNLNFIKSLDNLKLMGISMVVQKINYKQMPAFVELGESLVRDSRPTFVEFKRMQRGDSAIEHFNATCMDDIDQQTKEEFTEILNRVETHRLYNSKNNIMPEIRHNLHEYIAAPEVEEETSAFKRFSSVLSSLTPDFRR